MDNINLTQAELIKLVDEATEKLDSGMEVKELLDIYKERYSMQEAFLILMQAKLKNLIEPEFRDFTGKNRI